MLNRTNIDWNGNCIFEGGKVVGFKIANASNNYQMVPIPSNERTIADAKHNMEILKAIMKPATMEQVALIFKRLHTSCGKQNRSPEEMKYMFNDYYADLGKYPPKLIQDACDAYRRLPEGNEFMPQSGKLIALMCADWNYLHFLKSRIEKILGIYVEPLRKQNRTVPLDEAMERFKSNS